jgi:hypothetical protein
MIIMVNFQNHTNLNLVKISETNGIPHGTKLEMPSPFFFVGAIR